MKLFITITVAVLLSAQLCCSAPQSPQPAERSTRSPEDCGPVVLILMPVCGTDNKTYDNTDALRAYNCMEGRTGADEITVAHEGACKGDPKL